MTSHWYFNSLDQELGPITFRELAEMVREGQIAPEDRVRAEWEDEWRRADTVIGLFHMAARDPAEWNEAIEARKFVEGPEIGDTCDDALWAEASDEVEDDRPAWMRAVVKRIHQSLGRNDSALVQQAGDGSSAATETVDGESAGFDVTGGEADSAAEGRGLSSAIQDAIDHHDARIGEHGKSGRWWQFWRRQTTTGRSNSRNEWQQIACFGGAALAGNLTVLCVEAWGAGEALRFPGSMESRGVRVFPLVGECEPFMYWLLLIGLMIVGAVAGYFSVKWVLGNTELS
jgi:hypothetical protein